jgi:hypothetical protein
VQVTGGDPLEPTSEGATAVRAIEVLAHPRGLAPGLLALTVAAAVTTPSGTEAAAPARSITLEGRVELVTTDDPARGRATDTWTLVTGGRRVTLDVPKGVPLASGSRVRITGLTATQGLTVQRVTRTRAARRLATGSTAADPAAMRIAAIMVTLPADRTRPWSRDTIEETYLTGAGSAARYYEEVSNDRLTVGGRVFGWYDIDVEAGGCRLDDWMNAAEEAAAADGFDDAAFTHVSLIIPAATCRFAGAAVVNGRYSWIRSLGTDGSVVLHELGHNLGSQHAGAQRCVEGSCTVSEYGDPFSVMGRSHHGHPTNYQRAQMGLLTGSEIDRRTLAPGRHTLTLEPASLAGGSRLVRLARPDGRFLDLELRRPYGRFEDPAGAARTVLLSLNDDLAAGTDSMLLDTTPATPDEPDQGVPAGGTWIDARGGIGVHVRSVGDAGAVVEVTTIAPADGAPDRTPPTDPLALTLATVPGHTGVRLDWAPAMDAGAGGLRYEVLQNGRVVSETTDRTWRAIGLTAGTRHTWAVRALDAAGNTGPARSVEAVTLDRQAPRAPRGLTLVRLAPGTATIRWTASSDASGIAGYRLTVDGRRLRLAPATERTLRSLPRGWHDIAVVAVDTAGNAGRAATLSFRSR